MLRKMNHHLEWIIQSPLKIVPLLSAIDMENNPFIKSLSENKVSTSGII